MKESGGFLWTLSVKRVIGKRREGDAVEVEVEVGFFSLFLIVLRERERRGAPIEEKNVSFSLPLLFFLSFSRPTFPPFPLSALSVRPHACVVNARTHEARRSRRLRLQHQQQRPGIERRRHRRPAGLLKDRRQEAEGGLVQGRAPPRGRRFRFGSRGPSDQGENWKEEGEREKRDRLKLPLLFPFARSCFNFFSSFAAAAAGLFLPSSQPRKPLSPPTPPKKKHIVSGRPPAAALGQAPPAPLPCRLEGPSRKHGRSAVVAAAGQQRSREREEEPPRD